MITGVTQRWRDGRTSYRPSGETIRTADYDVAPIAGDSEAKAFILQHHYSRSFPAARFRFGLYRGGALVGVAVFSHPSNNRVLTGVFPGEAIESVELGRLVLLDEVPANGESWFVSRCFEALSRQEIIGVVSYSDPVARTSLAGEQVFPGHIGTIYQALNGVYLGRATARKLRILPDGTVLSDRTVSKIRARERGWQYAVQILERHGAAGLEGDTAEWLRTWLAKLTRPLAHGGNHKYAWMLNRRLRKHLPKTLPYPKFQQLTAA